MTDRHTVQRLDLATATGLWRVEGASGTTYTIDVDERLAIRQPAPGAPTCPYDGCWMRLVAVVNLEEVDVVRHGLRHRWDFDPAPGRPGVTIWWIQTAVTGIVEIGPAEGHLDAVHLPTRTPGPSPSDGDRRSVAEA